MSEIKKINYLIFFIVTMIFSGILTSTGYIENMIGKNIQLDIILKFIFIIVLLLYISQRNKISTLTNFNIPIPYILAALIPTVMSILLTACPLGNSIGTDIIVFTITGTLTTAIWEELYFRYVGCSLFEEDSKFKWYNILFLAFSFSMAHTLNIFSNGAFATMTQVIFTFGFGIFALALYISTRSILLTIISHFLMNSVTDFYTIFADQNLTGVLYCGNLYYPIFIFYVILLISLGLFILKKNNLITR